ncbi:LysM peptidoglycan-binding domain-containing protein, partial [Patescibacteria group bacterium]|nr:LysM peptidoglycan-binding domain-containing protein [Patescibacteria group bacterium]
SVSEVTLAPEETRIIPFTLTIPENASVGDHLGAVIAEKGELKPSGQPGLSIKTRVGIRVWNTVSGEIVKNLQISNVTWEVKNKKLTPKATTAEKIKTALGLNKEGFITLELKNEGNVHLMPMAEIEITDIFGGWVATLDNISLGTSALNQTTTVPVKWTNPSSFGWLTANITILYGDDQSVTAKKSFLIIPWTILFILILLIIVFVFGKLFWRLYYAKSKLNMTPYKITRKTTLTEIADKFNVGWKKLARINNLKPPYTLKKGEILFIPKKKK